MGGLEIVISDPLAHPGFLLTVRNIPEHYDIARIDSADHEAHSTVAQVTVSLEHATADEELTHIAVQKMSLLLQ